MTPAPALAAPPSCVYTGGAPTNSGLESVVSWRTSLGCTAATPGSVARVSIWSPGTVAVTPPYTMRIGSPTSAAGMLASRAATKSPSTPST